MLKDWWRELWNPDNRLWAILDRILFVILPIISLYLLFTPNIPQKWKDVMPNLTWLVPLGLWVLLSLTVIPLKLASKYRRDYLNLMGEYKATPKPELTPLYEIFGVHPDNTFDVRIFIRNQGKATCTHTIVLVVSIYNVDVISILYGRCQRIDELRGNTPTIQWNSSPGNIISPNGSLRIVDLRLKARPNTPASVYKATLEGEEIHKLEEAHVLYDAELENIRLQLEKKEKVFIKKVPPEIMHLAEMIKQGNDKGVSQT